MKILGIIPSRFASTRFPGKPLIDIRGKSMIRRVYEQASMAQIFNKIIVATDDARIFDHVKNFGGDVAMTSAEHSCGTDRCIEVVAKESTEYDVVINIQGDEPVIDPAQLAALSGAFKDAKVEIATLVKKVKSEAIIHDSSKVKVVRALNGDALYFSRQSIPFCQEADKKIAPGSFYKHIGIYAFRQNTLLKIKDLKPSPLEISESLEQLRWLEHGMKIRTVETEIESISVDVPADLERVLAILDKW